MSDFVSEDTRPNTIFIQIASYRDPELLPTLRDCIKNAEFPENLIFGICWQKADEDSLEEFANDPRFRVTPVPYRESKGACWARNTLQQLYKDEKYTLQIDSHMRFANHWDTLAINMVKSFQAQGHTKPLLTGYISSYDPENDPAGRVQVPWKMVLNKIIPETGIPMYLPSSFSAEETALNAPLKSKFYSAHFCFTLGEFSKEVQHDPNIYFTGEEINIAIRSYTHGYDLFHPDCIIVWHEYTRKGRTKHWDDHTEWWKTEEESKTHLKKFLHNIINDIPIEKYGLGKVRTFHEYELYSEIDFKNKKIRLRENEKEYEYTLQIPQTDPVELIVISVQDENNKQLFRKDLTEYVPSLKVSFISTSKPHKWIYWPCDKINGWYNRTETLIIDVKEALQETINENVQITIKEEVKENEYKYTLDIPFSENFDFILIAFDDVDGNSLFRIDLVQYVSSLGVVFKSSTKPHKWVYWHHNKENGWGKKIETIL